ncbi:hypothetical protein [Sphingomonas lacunae]|uniref:hypothetical protein n=1 Tax=Sphingomonas lacunae TaxID=2698828 RepID=UPI001BAFE63B|nr:hypothetical protein [Sphingomonas lacunae]
MIALASLAGLLALSSAAVQEAPAAPVPPPTPISPAPPRGGDVIGAWTVDLRVSETDAPYNQPMHLQVDADGKVTGDFYNSPISSGRYGHNMGRSCVAFVTSDGMGDYQHSACLVDGRMVGQSWAEHRGFVLPWTAVREQ